MAAEAPIIPMALLEDADEEDDFPVAFFREEDEVCRERPYLGWEEEEEVLWEVFSEVEARSLLAAEVEVNIFFCQCSS